MVLHSSITNMDRIYTSDISPNRSQSQKNLDSASDFNRNFCSCLEPSKFYGTSNLGDPNRVSAFTPVVRPYRSRDQLTRTESGNPYQETTSSSTIDNRQRNLSAKCLSCKCSLGFVVKLDYKSPQKTIPTPPNSNNSSPCCSLKRQDLICQSCSSSSPSSTSSLSAPSPISPPWDETNEIKFLRKSSRAGPQRRYFDLFSVPLQANTGETNAGKQDHARLETLSSIRDQSTYEINSFGYKKYLSTDNNLTTFNDLKSGSVKHVRLSPSDDRDIVCNGEAGVEAGEAPADMDDWFVSSTDSRDSENDDILVFPASPPHGIRKSMSLHDSKLYKDNKQSYKSVSDYKDYQDPAHSSRSAQICHLTYLDDKIKNSRSLPSHLNRNLKRNKNDWRSVDDKPPRTEGRKVLLDEIVNSVRDSNKLLTSIDESQILTRKMRKTICNLLNITPKLHKNLKRGLYLASLVHQDGKVLVTNEDVLPAIEIRCEQSPSEMSLKWDFNWFSKVLCNWSNVETLKLTFEKPRNIPDSMQFRFRLLQAAYYMQKIVGLENLGILHYQVLTDPVTSSQVFLLVNSLSEELKVSSVLKWCSIRKLNRKKQISERSAHGVSSIISSRSSLTRNETGVMEFIITSIPELISFKTSCSTKLDRGLYLGYVKLTSFIDQLRIMVSRNVLNVFPHAKMRDDPRVSREEWESIINSNRQDVKLTGRQEVFRHRLFETARTLLCNTGVPERDILTHRLYTNEVFEFSAEVSFILLLPNYKNVCSGLGEEERLKPGYMTLPLHQFEIYHMGTYHTDLTKRYSHVSTLVEAEVSIFNHLMRQEVSDEDELKLRERIGQLNVQQKKLDETWRGMRWISEVISNARDGRNYCGLTLDRIKPMPFNSCTNNC